MTEMIEVTQADRDAAAAVVSADDPGDAASIVAGYFDHHYLVTAFARHRLSVLSSLDKEGLVIPRRSTEADDLTGCTLPELLDRLPSAERLATVAEHLGRLERICAASRRCMTPEGAATKAVVYAFMQSSINDAAFTARALRQLLPIVRSLKSDAARSAGEKR